MSIQIDTKYANIVSSRLNQFKWRGDGSANFRCPLCGDSKKNKVKKRAWLFEHNANLMFKCWNCGEAMAFSNLLKQLDAVLYKEYSVENFQNDKAHKWYQTKPIKVQKPQPKAEDKSERAFEKKKSVLDSLDRCSNLSPEHICYKYLKARKIPLQHWQNLYYTDNYCQWINDNVVKNKFSKVPTEDKRLVIPFFTVEGEPFAFQGRDLTNSPGAIRYITISPNKNSLLVYGINKIEPNQDQIFVFEGPIDSLYIPNSMAVASSGLSKLLKFKTDKFIFVFDNEPRNKEIVKQMKKIIDSGAKVVIFPKEISYKDIGEMVQFGNLSPENVVDILKKNVYNGLEAILHFNNWKKI
jgi:predicted RNA-binding Zn-ribbon protein involved in translation (DUF1610 family)